MKCFCGVRFHRGALSETNVGDTESKRLEWRKQMVDEYFELDAMDDLDDAEMWRTRIEQSLNMNTMHL